MILTNIALIFLLGCKSIWAITTEEEEARALTEIANNINTLKKDLAVLQSFVKLGKIKICGTRASRGVARNFKRGGREINNKSHEKSLAYFSHLAAFIFCY